jgi:hypothetical protein
VSERVYPEPMLQFFAYAHLPERLQTVSAPFGKLADTIVAICPRNPERTAALRKLLEAKDCAVRAVLYQVEGGPDPGLMGEPFKK